MATLQDLGRPGWAHSGVGPGGAADRLAWYEAGSLLGWPLPCPFEPVALSGTGPETAPGTISSGVPDSFGAPLPPARPAYPALLEFHGKKCHMRWESPEATYACLVGAERPARLVLEAESPPSGPPPSGPPLPFYQRFRLPPGARLILEGAPAAGAYSYVALEAGFEGPHWLASRSVRPEFGWGHYLKSGDRLVSTPKRYGSETPGTPGRRWLEPWNRPYRASPYRGSPYRGSPYRASSYRRPGPLRIVWHPQARFLSRDERMELLRHPFVVARAGSRVGLRLRRDSAAEAPQNQRATEATETCPASSRTLLSRPSSAVLAGDLQRLGDGTLVLLLADHPPTGGYIRLATVIAADLPRAAQAVEGDAISFRLVSFERAENLARRFSFDLQAMGFRVKKA